jgi:hypothetical protein
MSPETIELLTRGYRAMEDADAASRESVALRRELRGAMDAVDRTAMDLAAMRLFGLQPAPDEGSRPGRSR